VPEERRSRIRKAHATSRPHEKGCAQLVLQFADLTAHGGLGDVELPSSAADVPLFGDGDEVFNLGEAHTGQRTSEP
jgi:hypothetical protein